MGRWAQQRKRGSDRNPSGPAFPLAPPTSEQWHPTSASLQIDASSDEACPEGADGADVQWRVEGDGPWTDVGDALGCGDSVNVLPTCVIDHDFQVRIRWHLDGTPVSDWSEPQPISCSI